MSDDLIQQVSQQAPSIGAGGLGGGLVAILAAFRMFATPKDVDLAKEQIRAEMAEKYAHKDEIAKLIIQRATIPAELEALRTQMLSVFS